MVLWRLFSLPGPPRQGGGHGVTPAPVAVAKSPLVSRWASAGSASAGWASAGLLGFRLDFGLISSLGLDLGQDFGWISAGFHLLGSWLDLA